MSLPQQQSFLPDSDWENFKQIIDDFSVDVCREIITWVQFNRGIPFKGNDDDNAFGANQSIDLNCLIQYNYFRTWPITNFQETGQEDKQSELIMINNSYLDSLGLLDGNGNFAYDPANDRFLHRGQLYFDAGNTQVAPTNSNPLYTIIILKRVDVDNLDKPTT